MKCTLAFEGGKTDVGFDWATKLLQVNKRFSCFKEKKPDIVGGSKYYPRKYALWTKRAL